jgi:hypothetical protein
MASLELRRETINVKADGSNVSDYEAVTLDAIKIKKHTVCENIKKEHSI